MLAARIKQQQIAVAQRLIVVAVVHDAGIGAAADDGIVGNVRIVRAKLVQHLGHDLVFHAPRAREAHGAAMRAHGDIRGAPQARLLGAALVKAHVVEHVPQRNEFVGRAGGLARLHPQAIDPAQNGDRNPGACPWSNTSASAVPSTRAGFRRCPRSERHRPPHSARPRRRFRRARRPTTRARHRARARTADIRPADGRAPAPRPHPVPGSRSNSRNGCLDDRRTRCRRCGGAPVPQAGSRWRPCR